MIVQEQFEINGRQFIRTYSDSGRYVVGGEPYGEYSESCDPADAGRAFVEGREIPTDPEASMSDKAEAYDILMGVSE